jgi:hypothetical protein
MRRPPAILALWGLAVAAAAAGCKPDLGAPASLVSGPRLLAVRATPPDATPGVDMVTYDALAVDVTGTVASPAIDWAQCLAPDPPAFSNDVSDACLAIPDDTTAPAPTFTAIPDIDDCSVFGPDTPPPKKGQPPTRAADPDTTGGYYQPVRARWQSDAGPVLAFTLERIICHLANAPVTAAGEFASTYTPNKNPVLAALTYDPAGAALPLYAAGQAAPPAAVSVAAGASVTLEADFSADSAETFPVWDVVSLALVQQRESLRVSWFATGGTFDHDATGRTSDETETFTQNVWTAPETPGPVSFWAVLRDSRGGLDFASATIDVTP